MDGSLCARPDCSQTAAATLTYDYRSRTVWIDPPRHDLQAAWALCTMHAESLKVPVGWGLHDRRKPVIVPPVPAPAAVATEPPIAS